MSQPEGLAPRTASRRREGGFTLIEMLVVIIIIVLMATMSVALLGSFFRGQGARQGAMIVTQAVAQAKQEAARAHKYFFVVFSKQGQDGFMEIHKDMNDDGVYQGDDNPKTVDADPMVDGAYVDLPKFVAFEYSPAWMSFSPSGYLGFSPGFKEVQASTFDAVMNGDTPSPIGDIILRVLNKPYIMCLDLDRASGKVRRHHFINQEDQ